MILDGFLLVPSEVRDPSEAKDREQARDLPIIRIFAEIKSLTKGRRPRHRGEAKRFERSEECRTKRGISRQYIFPRLQKGRLVSIHSIVNYLDFS